METLFADFASAYNQQLGYQLASTISPVPPATDPARLYSIVRGTNAHDLQNSLRYGLQYNPGLRLDADESKEWFQVFLAFFKFAGRLLAAEEAENARAGNTDWLAVYNAWKEVVNALLHGYQSNNFDAWTLPCLYVAGRYLRVLGIKADDAAALSKSSGATWSLDEDGLGGGNTNEQLEDAARQINRIFGICNNDRNPIEDSRKWALYYIGCLLFKIYFRLSQISLCKNVVRTIQASPDLPPLTSYPRSHQVTYNYYLGVIYFLSEDYKQAEAHLVDAYKMCNAKAVKNTELILMYLIPTKMITKGVLPSTELLSRYTELHTLFAPVSDSIKHANLAKLNQALEHGEAQFVKRRVYLTLERARDVAIRNLFRKVYLAGGYEPIKENEVKPTRRSRIPINEFAAALAMAGADVSDGDGGVDQDEVECIIANLIYKNLMKGYIARERGMVVLSKAGAFPDTGV